MRAKSFPVPNGRTPRTALDPDSSIPRATSFTVPSPPTGNTFESTAPRQFLIRAAGGVGIGEANPSAQLDVVGTTELNGDVTINSRLTVTTDTVLKGNLSVATETVLNGNLSVGTDSLLNGNLTVMTDTVLNGNLTVDSDALFVDGASNRVGIGTSAPSNRLSVVGGADFNTVAIGTEAGAGRLTIANGCPRRRPA